MHNTSNRIKLILFLTLGITIFSSNIHAQSNAFLCSSDNFDEVIEAENIQLIDITTAHSKKWSKNYFRAIKSGGLISEEYKKKFSADIKVRFDNELECTFPANIRISGDRIDHLGCSSKDSNCNEITSLDVDLLAGNINSVVEFKLFISDTKNGDNEVFSTALLSELGYLAPKTYHVPAIFNGIKTNYLFQEKITKEFIESNDLREAPILEGDERFLFNSELLVFDRFGLARMINKNWAEKGYTSLNISKTALNQLNRAYLEYLVGRLYNIRNKRFLNPNAFSDGNSMKSKGYPAILVAIGASHALRPHNRSFYYDPIYKYFIPIYYDGNATLTYSDSILDEYRWFGLHLNKNEIDGASFALESLKNLNPLSLHSRLGGLGLNYSLEEVNTILEKIERNLMIIQNTEFVNYKDLKDSPYFTDISRIAYEEKQKENYNEETDFHLKDYEKKRKLVFSTEKDSHVEICDLLLKSCFKDTFSIKNYSKLLAGRYSDNNIPYIFIGNKQEYLSSNNPQDYEKERTFDLEEGAKLVVYGSSKIVVDKKDKIIQLNQSNISDRFLIKSGKLKDWTIHYIGLRDVRISDEQAFNQNLLTGCLTLIDLSVENIRIEMDYASCEDGVNLYRVGGNINNLVVQNVLNDAIDVDFSNLQINNINVRDAGNDCVDLSYGDYHIDYADLSDCKDKAISTGEKSKLTINSAQISKSKIGVAAKDSSVVEINAVNTISTSTCFSAYNKKQEFWGGKIIVKKHNCQPNQIFQENGSLVEFIQ